MSTKNNGSEDWISVEIDPKGKKRRPFERVALSRRELNPGLKRDKLAY
jgi:hypothetical protein